MTREEFITAFDRFIRNRAERWFPEESTEEDFLNIMQERVREHHKAIMEVFNEGVKT